MKNHLTLLLLFCSINVFAQINGLKKTTVATGITNVTDIVNCNDDRLFFVQQNGIIKIYKNGAIVPQPFLNITTLTSGSGEQGLLGLAFSPNYFSDGFFFVDYTNTSGNTVIARFQVSSSNPDSAMNSSQQILLTITQPYSNHNGGCVRFDHDGYLMIGMGDGGSANDPNGNGQNKKAMLAKLLRIDVSDTSVNYKIPPTNPFVNDTSFLPEIWAWGMRNPWRFSFDRLTHDLWIGDVGQNLYEEIDMEPNGSGGGFNYGWRCYEANHSFNLTGCQSQSNYTFPVIEYPHGSSKCSVSGGVVYRGASYNRLYGKYIYADYCDNNLRFVSKSSTGVYADSLLLNLGTNNSGISCFGTDKNGELYFGNNTYSIVYKLEDTLDCTPVANISSLDTLRLCGVTSTILATPDNPSFFYQWYQDGAVIPNSDTSSITVTQNGNYYVQVFGINFCANTSDSVTVLFYPAVSASISNLDTIYCSSDPSINLTGIPAGGIFSIDGNVNTVLDPSVLAFGNHNVIYQYTDSNGCTASASQQVNIFDCTGINTVSGNLVKVIPNPNNGNFTIAMNGNFNGETTIQILDLTGRIVYEKKIYTQNKNSINVEAHKLPESFYFLKLLSNDTSVIQKILIKK